VLTDSYPGYISRCIVTGKDHETAAANAAFIAKAVNEHDTLKAKAELLDKFIAWSEMPSDDSMPSTQCTAEMVLKVGNLIDKTKEINQ
jgi:hypothetical protein